jgi:RecA-family ATPase
LHRFNDVYNSLGWGRNNVANIDIWNLRGKSVPMDKLAPKLIRRAQKKNYIAIIIDPIYKVITGDENSADQMAKFCNQFDLVCNELNAATIYCHHHSKGAQGNKKSADRSSGSGVFARDPDAILDLIQLDLNEDIIKQEENKAVCKTCESWLKNHTTNYKDDVSLDDLCSEKAMQEHCKKLLPSNIYTELEKDVEATRKTVKGYTAWRIEGTLREFPSFAPVNVWFRYPVHVVDDVGSLKDIEAEGAAPPWKANFKKKKSPEQQKKDKKISLENAIEACGFDGKPTVQKIAEYLGTTEKTVRNRIKEHGGFWVDESEVGKK